MWPSIMGLLIQLLSACVGAATGRLLAELCREGYPNWARLIFFIFLFLENYGVRKLEAVFAILIATMALSIGWMFGDSKPSVSLPRLDSKTIWHAVGVVRCVTMPHNVFLHSALVQSRKIDPQNKVISCFYTLLHDQLVLTTFLAKGIYGTEHANSIGLVNAGQYLQQKSGQSSTITGTFAGQFIMGNLRLKKWLRALIICSSSLDILNEWINLVKSIKIPFALIPHFTLVASRSGGSLELGLFLILACTVTILIILINSYLLLDFFASEIEMLFSCFRVIMTKNYQTKI
ncbi:hypothetical protein P3X46_021075 [Hevea brasiliensis]|uniref:Uncharacterized protein n=1 Tax=Hevea brasiliensis TaxID=3981 RepID=A0ABQ9LEF7_HEVBR|nr:hypothetical protein P3X46_021075 [Hevea brasiliensis]